MIPNNNNNYYFPVEIVLLKWNHRRKKPSRKIVYRTRLSVSFLKNRERGINPGKIPGKISPNLLKARSLEANGTVFDHLSIKVREIRLTRPIGPDFKEARKDTLELFRMIHSPAPFYGVIKWRCIKGRRRGNGRLKYPRRSCCKSGRKCILLHNARGEEIGVLASLLQTTFLSLSYCHSFHQSMRAIVDN